MCPAKTENNNNNTTKSGLHKKFYEKPKRSCARRLSAAWKMSCFLQLITFPLQLASVKVNPQSISRSKRFIQVKCSFVQRFRVVAIFNIKPLNYCKTTFGTSNNGGLISMNGQCRLFLDVNRGDNFSKVITMT